MGKQKKQERKLEAELKNQRRKHLNGLLESVDLLSAFPPFRSFLFGISSVLPNSKVKLHFQYVWPEKLSPVLLDHFFRLTEENMKNHYIVSGFPWDEKEKKSTLRKRDGRYIIVYYFIDEQGLPLEIGQQRNGGESSGSSPTQPLSSTSSSSSSPSPSSFKLSDICQDPSSDDLSKRIVPTGFANFFFDDDDDELILFLYELQLEKTFQGSGIGAFLMKILELVARKNNFDGLRFCVEKTNVGAKKFYEKLKFQMLQDNTDDDGTFLYGKMWSASPTTNSTSPAQKKDGK